MLHLIPASLHRLLYRVAFHGRRFWLRVFAAEIHGCSVIARDGQGRVLLVRHSYGSRKWAFPGGGLNRGEQPLEGALRELFEELGCTVASPVHLGTLQENYYGTRNVAYVFTGMIEGEPRPDMREIVEARFFSCDDLPPQTSNNVVVRLRLLSGWSAGD